MANKQYGVINEVGDLGLGFDPVPKKDQRVLQEGERTKKEETESKTK